MMNTLAQTLQKFTSDMEAAESASQNKTSLSDAQSIIKELDRAIVEKERKQPRRKYLGASSLGDPCSRKLQYRYMNQQVDEGKGFPAKTLCIFGLGHTIEDIQEAIDYEMEKAALND